MNSTDFFKKSEEERLTYYKNSYLTNNQSWGEIAKTLETYPNKVRRDATKLGIVSRDKSQAQKTAIQQGRHEHPTAGKKQSEKTKMKISESQGKVWDSMTEEERQYRSKIGNESWNKKTEEEKAEFFRRSTQAIQEASRKGSKMERHIFDHLTRLGYKVDRHKEYMLKNDKFHIDLYIPSCRLAIEVDGPMHFEPVFGEDRLKKRQAADSQKNGLILSSGMVLLRVKLLKRESQRYFRQISEQIEQVISNIETKFPSKNERYFEI